MRAYPAASVTVRRPVWAAAFLFFLCAGFAHAQKITLDEALRKAAGGVSSRLARGTTVSIVDVETSVPKLSSYILDELSSRIVRNGKLNLINRNLVSLALKELQFQESGMVNDDSARKVGKFLGAAVIIRVSFTDLGDNYRLSVEALEVETTRIPFHTTYTLYVDKTLSNIIGEKSPAKKDAQKSASAFSRFLNDSDVSWKYQWLYPAVRVGFSPRSYTLDAHDIPAQGHTSFEAAAIVEARITPRVALQTELVFSGDTVKAHTGESAVDIRAVTAGIPLLAKLTWRPRRFYFALFCGPDMVFPLGKMNVTRQDEYETLRDAYDFTSSFGLTAGGNAGVHVGRGVLFLDVRGRGDFVFVRANEYKQYRRFAISLSVGYSMGFFERNN